MTLKRLVVLAAMFVAVWSGTSALAQTARLPAGPRPISAGFFDPGYPPSQSRQHLGTDFVAPAGTPVFAPIGGKILRNRTDAPDVMEAYLVIRAPDGVEHVLGHIASPLKEGATVKAGEQVGTIRSWLREPGRSHVHWGVNRLGIVQAMTGGWGWGRAPVSTTRAQAQARGWVDAATIGAPANDARNALDMPETRAASGDALCPIYGWWAPSDAPDYGRDGVAISAGDGNGPTIRWRAAFNWQATLPARFDSRRLQLSYAGGQISYDPRSGMISTPKGAFKRFVTYVERGCPDTDGMTEDTVVATERTPAAAPSPSPARGNRDIVLSDANARSIWSTSVYSYTGRGGGPGGGLADDRLRVGGWGDRYVSLLRFDLPDQRTVRRAVLILTVKGDDAGSTPTPMNVRVVNGPWRWAAGDRLWWKDLPASDPVFQTAAPGGAGSTFTIDITAIYNAWVKGNRANQGIMLDPMLTNNNYSTFYSTRADPRYRPRLVLSY